MLIMKGVFNIIRILNTTNIRRLSQQADKRFFLDVAEHKRKLGQENKSFAYNQTIEELGLKEEHNQPTKESVKYDGKLITDNIDNAKSDKVDLSGQVLQNIIPENKRRIIANNLETSQSEFCSVKQKEKEPNKDLCESESLEGLKPLDVESLKQEIELLRLDELSNILSDVATVGPLVDRHLTLSNLLKMGVDLYQIEKENGGANLLIRLDWEKDVVPLMNFLTEQANFTDKQMAKIFSYFPKIFRCSLESIQEVFDYFRKRNIIDDDLISIINKVPKVLSYDVKNISEKIGTIESMLKLKSFEMNKVVLANLQIFSTAVHQMTGNLIQLKKMQGFTMDELKKIIISEPKILTQDTRNISKNFIFLHRSLDLSYEDIVRYASALAASPAMLESRTKYLLYLNRYQTDPTKELYTPLNAIISGTDSDFCRDVARTSLAKYRKYLKTQ